MRGAARRGHHPVLCCQPFVGGNGRNPVVRQARQHHLASLRAVAPPHARWRGLATARAGKSGATPAPARKANWASDEVRRLAEGGDVAKALDRAKASRVDRSAWFSLLKALNRRATTHTIRGSRIPRMARLALTEMARQRTQPEARDVTAAINACVTPGWLMSRRTASTERNGGDGRQTRRRRRPQRWWRSCLWTACRR